MHNHEILQVCSRWWLKPGRRAPYRFASTVFRHASAGSHV
ncbi:hypothetical protein D777_02547 [Marinobacter nitratireducens]|uniref:Uncharacterized protein n=1 Tax=Marinobacter nitratireducens TaxID=1137280 RepID=A0A072NC32_9GAMM|nr:hypothetical protein D777_02547 [Marinobacter nitratireducens]